MHTIDGSLHYLCDDTPSARLAETWHRAAAQTSVFAVLCQFGWRATWCKVEVTSAKPLATRVCTKLPNTDDLKGRTVLSCTHTGRIACWEETDSQGGLRTEA